jgi:hypothetical protein
MSMVGTIRTTMGDVVMGAAVVETRGSRSTERVNEG